MAREKLTVVLPPPNAMDGENRRTMVPARIIKNLIDYPAALIGTGPYRTRLLLPRVLNSPGSGSERSMNRNAQHTMYSGRHRIICAKCPPYQARHHFFPRKTQERRGGNARGQYAPCRVENAPCLAGEALPWQDSAVIGKRRTASNA